MIKAWLYTHSQNTRPKTDPPDIQIGLLNNVFGSDSQQPTAFSLFVGMIRPQSRGMVSLRSANPLAPVVIRNNYLQFQSEMDVLVEGIRMAREITHAQGLANFKGEEIWPGQDLQSKKELEEYVRISAITIAHPSCTCKMGLDRMAVGDPELRVHGIEALRVADASIMPEIINSPTNATCIMIGEKAADLIKTAQYN
jgi:choline dehydrogenase